MTRLTEDGQMVYAHTKVWEVVWRYLNTEISIAEPESREAGEIPDAVPIYFFKRQCQIKCAQLNKPPAYEII